jgi:hypothetical protein
MNYIDRMIIRALTEGRHIHTTPTVTVRLKSGPADRLFWEPRESTLGAAFGKLIQGKVA